MSEAELEIATADKTRVKKLNPRQAKFVKLYTGGGMSRAQAYMAAYGQKDESVARRDAANLIVSNSVVKAEIDRILDTQVARVQERLLAEADATVDQYFLLRDMGNSEYSVRLRACIDHMDRIGLKPVEQVEMSGEVVRINVHGVNMDEFPEPFIIEKDQDDPE